MQESEKREGPIQSILSGQIPYLRRYARGLTHNVADADDLVQGCLVRAVANLHRFQRDTNIRAWLLTIMHNLFIDGARKKRRMREAFEAANVAQGGLLQLPNQVHRIQLTELETALSRLPPEQKSTLLLIALEDRTYEEAAAITGVPVGTVRSRLSRARQSLVAAIDGLDADDLRGGRVRHRIPPAGGAARPVPLQVHRKDNGRGGPRVRLRKAVAAA